MLTSLVRTVTRGVLKLRSAMAASAVGVAALAAPVAQAATPQKVYLMELTGEFGYDISQTPIREAMRDARNNGADVVIVKIDAKWEQNAFEPLPDTAANFDELFRAEKILPIFADEIAREWEKPPRVVMWVKRAMGGPAFIPFIAPEIYFTTDGRMGGIGGIGVMLGGQGDEVVRQKQYSLRMARAEGFVIRGGYDPKIIRAMAEPAYVLSYRLEGGRPVFLEREPERPDEFILTTNTQDSMEASVRGMTRSVLTLNADLARAIGVSKGTVDNLDDLLFQLGLSRNHEIIKGRSERIMEGWRRDLENATREIRRRLEELNNADQGGGGGNAGNAFDQRTQDRARRMRNIDEITARLRRFQEAFGPRWHGQNGVPQIAELNIMREQLELQQLVDRK